ncbi:MAG: ATP-binding protein [Syntrophobacterales bacterium]|nr:ATP-binding protein [Syntrophobacterales bacterium]
MSVFGWILHQQEGQFFERKSCCDRSQGKVKLRPVRDVAWDVAETLAAMANADGSVLVLGIEDDSAVSGADYPEDRLKILHSAPKTHIKPAVKARIRENNLDGKQVLLFEVGWSMEAHQLTDCRYLLRIDDKNIPSPAADIEAMKEGSDAVLPKRALSLRRRSPTSILHLSTDLANGRG